MPKPSLLKLFWIFFKIGMVLFGGGYAILPFLKSEICEKEEICTLEELTDYYAMSQCFPGLVGGNVSMFIGNKARGAFGAIACIAGVCLPAILSIILIFSFLSLIVANPTVINVFQVLDIAVCILIFLTILELWGFSVFDKFTVFIFLVALIASALNISPFVVVISAGILSVIRHVCFPKDQTGCEKSVKSEVNKHE